MGRLVEREHRDTGHRIPASDRPTSEALPRSGRRPCSGRVCHWQGQGHGRRVPVWSGTDPRRDPRASPRDPGHRPVRARRSVPGIARRTLRLRRDRLRYDSPRSGHRRRLSAHGHRCSRPRCGPRRRLRRSSCRTPRTRGDPDLGADRSQRGRAGPRRCVRVGRSYGAADAHIPGRTRHRNAAHPPPRWRDRDDLVRSDLGVDDRHRCRHRLRALHSDPSSPAPRCWAGGGRSCRARWRPPDRPSSSPG